MQASTIELDTPDGPMACYEARPEGGAAKAVIVIQEGFGVNRHIETVCERFAEVGYHAVAPHLFHRAGGGTASYDDLDKVRPLVASLSDDGILQDVDATLGHLRGAGFDDRSVGIVGFCMGGRVAFLVALHRSLAAAVTFYGGGIVTQRFPQLPALAGEVGDLQTPWLGLFGDEDQSIPVDDVETLREALAAAPVETDVVRYRRAEHGFFCDERPSFDRDAASDGWERMLAWFDRHLTTRPRK